MTPDELEDAWILLKDSLASEWGNHQEPDEFDFAKVSLDLERGVLVYTNRREDRYDPENIHTLFEVRYEIPLRNVDPSKVEFDSVHLRLGALSPDQSFTAWTKSSAVDESPDLETSLLLRLNNKFFSSKPTDEGVLQLVTALANLATHYQP